MIIMTKVSLIIHVPVTMKKKKKKKKKRKAMNMLSSIMGHRGRAKIRVLPTIENNKRIKSAKEMR